MAGNGDQLPVIIKVEKLVARAIFFLAGHVRQEVVPIQMHLILRVADLGACFKFFFDIGLADSSCANR